MQQITKLCADSLRTFTNDNYGIKLKAAHAHELVAAYFGYQSKNAMLADTKYPVSNLRKASFIVLAPTAPIDQRRKNLQDLPPELPDTYRLSEGVYSGLISEKWLLSKPWPTYEMLATKLADDYLRQNRTQYAHYKPTGEGVKVKYNDDSVKLVVSRLYQIPTIDGPPTHNSYPTITIDLPRVAAHIGYGIPDISATIEAREIGQDRY